MLSAGTLSLNEMESLVFNLSHSCILGGCIGPPYTTLYQHWTDTGSIVFKKRKEKSMLFQHWSSISDRAKFWATIGKSLKYWDFSQNLANTRLNEKSFMKHLLCELLFSSKL